MKNMTSLHSAARDGDVSTVAFLLDNHVLVDAQDHDERTPLHVAAYLGHQKIVETLIDKGASINMRDKILGDTPFHRAASNSGNCSVLETLIERRAF